MKLDYKDVSVDGLRINDEVKSLLDKYDIVTYEDLRREIKNNNFDIKTNYFLSEALNDLEYFLQSQKYINEDELNKIKEAKQGREKYKLNNIDSKVRAIDLPCFTLSKALFFNVFGGKIDYDRVKEEGANKRYPYHECKMYGYNPHTRIQRIIDNATIKDLKQKKERVYVNSKNEIKPYLFGDRVGEVRYANILKSIEFYDKYIEYLLSQNYNVENPFYYMQKEKFERVRKNSIEIFSYLDKEGVEFIFGSMGKLLEVSKDAKDFKTIYTGYISSKYTKLANVEKIIANFITFDEAMDVTSPKVLSKFITPYGKR